MLPNAMDLTAMDLTDYEFDIQAASDEVARAWILYLVSVWIEFGGGLTWRGFIKRLNAYRDVASALRASFGGVRAAIEETQTSLEVGLFGLAKEVAQWPDEYVLYPHGTTEENPHVWYPVKRVVPLYAATGAGDNFPERSSLGAVFHRTSDHTMWMFFEDGWRPLAAAPTVEKRDHQCTCGLYKSDHDRTQRWSFGDDDRDFIDVTISMDGVIARDVQ